MGHKLLQEYAIFRLAIKYLDDVLSRLQQKPAWTIEEALLEPAATSQIHDPTFSQTVCTALQIALVALLRQWGISPVAVVGHSSGKNPFRVLGLSSDVPRQFWRLSTNGT